MDPRSVVGGQSPKGGRVNVSLRRGWRPGTVVAAVLVAVTVAAQPAAGQAAGGNAAGQAASLAPFVPTPQDVVERMLDLAGVTGTDVVYDLGSGDGRLVITAAKKYGARGVGVDIDPDRVAESQANARRAGVEHLVRFERRDALDTDVSEATVVTLYLLSSSNMKLRPILTRQLRPGARIVSHAFGMGDWTPDKVEDFRDSNGSTRRLYLWRTDGTVRP
jgi:SAM-dependent methyltransferase